MHALAGVRLRREDVSPWAAGDDEQGTPSERRCSELGLTDAVVFFLGGERAYTGDSYETADALVLLSTTEGLSMALFEAMAAGAGPEAVNGSGCGLAEAIDRLSGDPALRSAMGQAGRDCYLAHFAPERMAGRYLELYRTGK